MSLSQIYRVALYRFKGDLARRGAGYLGLILVIGAIGAVALASLAGARRTESSFPAYVASTNPSTVGMFSRYDDPALGITTGYDPAQAAAIAHLPLVTGAGTAIIFDGNISINSISGVRLGPSPGEAPPAFLGSMDGEFTTLDRVTLLSGRLADPTRVNEAVMNSQAAQQLGVHVGSVIRIPFYTDAQVLSPVSSAPHLVATVKLVGVVILSRDVIESDIAALNAATVIFSPALTRELALTCATGTESFLQLASGTSNAKRVLADAYVVDPIAAQFPAQVTTQFEPSAQQSVTPEAVALGVFGAIAALSALLVAGLMICRLLRERSDDAAPMRALGADRAMLTGDAVATLTGSIVIGSLLAVGGAVALSPLAPLGRVRAVYRGGVAYDWAVLGLGLLALVLVLASVAAFVAYRNSSPVLASRDSHATREPLLARMSAVARLPVSMETGLRFAVGPVRGRNAAPVRSAISGGVLAVMVLVAAVTFGGSLNNLVAHPPLYGWNWDYALLSSFAGAEDLPGPQVAGLLKQDHFVQSWSGINLATAKLDGQRVQVLAERPGAAVAPPLLSGHGLTAANEILLGGSTMASLHKQLGDTVTLSTGYTKPLHLRIVGTVTMPALAQMTGGGTGAVASPSAFPAKLLNLQDAPIPGPNVVLVRIRPGVDPAAALRSLEMISAKPALMGLGGGVISLLRPVEIVNFRSMGTTPAVLAASVAAGAFVALGLTLAAAVRRRRRELALLKTLGFTRRQLAASIASQAMVAAVVGIAFGMPLGYAIGRQLWLLFAKAIHVVPEASVPPLAMVLIGAGALALAVVAAALPGIRAAQTPAALILRSE